MVLKSETGAVSIMPTEGAVGGKLIIDANGNPINILDVRSERRIYRYSEKSTVGIVVSYSEKDYVAKVKTAIGEMTGIYEEKKIN